MIHADTDKGPVSTHRQPLDFPFLPPIGVRIPQPLNPETGRANATFVMLARNSDVDGAVSAIRSLEEQFNRRRPSPYPWVFLNEVPFDDEFKQKVSAVASSEVQFGLIKAEEWYQPDWIDEKLVEKGKEWLKNLPEPWPIPYADSTPYRNMCRYNSGVVQLSHILRFSMLTCSQALLQARTSCTVQVVLACRTGSGVHLSHRF